MLGMLARAASGFPGAVWEGWLTSAGSMKKVTPCDRQTQEERWAPRIKRSAHVPRRPGSTVHAAPGSIRHKSIRHHRASGATEPRAGPLSSRAQRRRAPRRADSALPCISLSPHSRLPPTPIKCQPGIPWLCCPGNLGCCNTGALPRLAVGRSQQRHERPRTLAIKIPPHLPSPQSFCSRKQRTVNFLGKRNNYFNVLYP